MSLWVEEVYGHATIQGAPVTGRRRFGVPPGGAFDPLLQHRINAIVGNFWDAPVLELALCQLTLRAVDDVALAWGGDAEVSVDGFALLEQQGGEMIPAGSTITFEAPKFGARQWVAATGGFVIRTPGVLRRGDVLELGAGRRSRIPNTLKMKVEGPLGADLHAMPGRPEFRQLFKNAYTVRHDSDRIGIRLDGPRMAHSLELPSEPATPGVVQITPEGLPIILGPDGPTIGGYPRAAVVIAADLPVLAQLRPGTEIRFALSSASAAREALAALERMQELVLGLYPSPI
jgi:biotin-dependent carboxylase-like uncharacterized protein